ncbi:F-box protein: endocytic membrane traffic, recycling ReCYcling 1 [Rhizina undulata]
MPAPNRLSVRQPPAAARIDGLAHKRSTMFAGSGGKSTLPAEIMSSILDYLPVSDLMRFARVSRRMQEMVYDDTRWVFRLRLMGVWNEVEARKRFEDVMRKRRAAQAARAAEEKEKGEKGPASAGAGKTDTLFDAVEEEKRATHFDQSKRKAMDVDTRRQTAPPGLAENFDLMTLSPTIQNSPRVSIGDPSSLLSALPSVRSIRGFARHEYGRVYAALAPLYFDLAKARTHMDPVVFRIYRDPEQQAQILAQLRVFSKSDTAYGFIERKERLNSMTSIFENAALREFEGGYEVRDIDGRMKRYANVLILLNGGQACIQLFVQKHPVMFEREKLGNPMDSFDNPTPGTFSLVPSSEFFNRLSVIINEQTGIIDRVFPRNANVMIPFLERIAEDVITEYITNILDEAHEREIETYLKAAAGIFHQCIQFGRSITAPKGAGETFKDEVIKIMTKVFDAHVDMYLQDELDFFRQKCESEVDSWHGKITEEDAATESFFMSNINREEVKRDFLSSFRKVILMPVSVIPLAFTMTSKPATSPVEEVKSPNTVRFSTPTSNRVSVQDSNKLSVQDPLDGSRSSTPGAGGRASPAPPPTTELAAKVAIMNSRLEGMRTLFSLEVALNLVHTAKSSLERAALFAAVGGQTGGEAKEQCEAIFIALLQILGTRHIKAGFDKAVDHLSKYDPREVAHDQLAVAPLVTFVELVNVGDLIQQMIDVFYEQELVAAKLTDRHDFLNPAAKEKKRFEKMLDERVAAGLNVGIDVLMNEVDHIFATTQQTTDFNPGAIGEANPRDLEIGPTATAIKVVEVVSSHTKLLTGSTDKNVLDVFNHEVGVRLFASLCKHIKRQRISVDGAVKLICDVNHYHSFIISLKLRQVVPYFNALRELSQIYLIDSSHARQMATVIADPNRFGGIFPVEEVYEYTTRREDWYVVKKDVERAMYGIGCCIQ